MSEEPRCDFVSHLNLTRELEQLRDQLEILEQWKEEAMTVESTWDVQEVGKELGLTLGTDILPQILPKIRELRTQLAAAHESQKNFRERTEKSIIELERQVAAAQAVIAMGRTCLWRLREERRAIIDAHGEVGVPAYLHRCIKHLEDFAKQPPDTAALDAAILKALAAERQLVHDAVKVQGQLRTQLAAAQAAMKEAKDVIYAVFHADKIDSRIRAWCGNSLRNLQTGGTAALDAMIAEVIVAEWKRLKEHWEGNLKLAEDQADKTLGI